MYILFQFLPVESEGFELAHGIVSYSSTSDLKRRLAHFCCDVHVWQTTMAPMGHTIQDCRMLWSLVGKLKLEKIFVLL